MHPHNERMNIISKKKPSFPVNGVLTDYLNKYLRYYELPVQYKDMLRFTDSIPLRDKDDNETLWHSVSYSPSEQGEIHYGLLKIYVMLTANGNEDAIEHLSVDRVDYCLFGNSFPFRIKIINQLNDNYDYYYLKTADASRIYGLELEHILSPNKINFLVYGATLIEEHIVGIPGDQFLKENLNREEHNKVRLGKEFVKFNERCFIRLLGDMRSYNFVIDVTPDFDKVQYRIRALDFDQQSFEGRKNMYLPQFFKENNPFVKMAMELLSGDSIIQYQKEERAQIKRRISVSDYQLKDLMDTIKQDHISTEDKIVQLKKELSAYHKNPEFLECRNMGQILESNMDQVLNKA